MFSLFRRGFFRNSGSGETKDNVDNSCVEKVYKKIENALEIILDDNKSQSYPISDIELTTDDMEILYQKEGTYKGIDAKIFSCILELANIMYVEPNNFKIFGLFSWKKPQREYDMEALKKTVENIDIDVQANEATEIKINDILRTNDILQLVLKIKKKHVGHNVEYTEDLTESIQAPVVNVIPTKAYVAHNIQSEDMTIPSGKSNALNLTNVLSENTSFDISSLRNMNGLQNELISTLDSLDERFNNLKNMLKPIEDGTLEYDDLNGQRNAVNRMLNPKLQGMTNIREPNTILMSMKQMATIQNFSDNKYVSDVISTFNKLVKISHESKDIVDFTQKLRKIKFPHPKECKEHVSEKDLMSPEYHPYLILHYTLLQLANICKGNGNNINEI